MRYLCPDTSCTFQGLGPDIRRDRDMDDHGVWKLGNRSN